MSGSRTALKVITAILIIFAIIEIVLGVLLLIGASLPEFAYTFIAVEGQLLTEASISLTFGVTFIILGIIYFIIGSLGWRGAKRPSKIGPFFWLSIIGAVLSVVGLIMSIVQGSISPSSIISTIVVVICAILANNIRNNSKKIKTGNYSA